MREFPQSEREVLAAHDILSIAIVPIFVERMWWGFIGFDECLAEREWAAPEIEALRAAADILGAALQRKQRERELAALFAVARAAGQSLDPDEILSDSLDSVLETLKVEVGGIMLLENDGQTLKLRAHRGISPELAARVGPVRLSEGMLSQIAAMHQAMMTDSIVPYLPDRLNAVLQQEGFQTVAGVPLVAKDQIVGALGLASRQRRALSPETLDFLTSVGRQLGVAIENALLYSEARQSRDAVLNMMDDLTEARDREQARARELELLAERLGAAVEHSDRLATQLAAVNRLDRVISSSLDLNEIYRAFAEESRKIIAFDRMAVALVEGDQVRLRAAGAGLEVVGGVEAVFPLEGSIIKAVIESGRALIRRDLAAEARYPTDRQLIEAGVRSDVLAPLMAKGQTLGAFNVGSCQVGAYSEKDLPILQSLAAQLAIAIENAQLYSETQQRLAELSALFTVSSALREARTLEEMLPIILRSTLEALSYDQGILSLVDRQRDEVVVRVTLPRQESLLGLRTKIGQGIAGRVVQTGRPMLPADFANLQPPEFVRRVVGEPRTVICYPLQTAAEVVGAIYLSATMPREYSEGEVKLLAAIADMAANAIHRAGLFEQLAHRVHELTALFDMGKMVTATLRIEDIQKFVVRAATQAVQVEGCYLFLWDAPQERLVLRASVGFLAEDVGRIKYRLGEGLAGLVFLESRSAKVTDLATDPRWKRDPEYEALLPAGQANSALVVPLTVGQKTLGVLGMVNKVGGTPFTASDESLLTALAGQTAIAIENARLYEDVRGLSVATIRSLATAIDARDPYTRGHSEGVASLSVLLGHELGWNETDLEMLEFAALLHDVGKIAVPDAILRKVEPLTPTEWNIIRLHPYHSAQIVKPVEPLQSIVPWVYNHQERWDGSGYPDGLKGESISLAARIIAVADAFNAMTTDRPYRKALSKEAALVEIERNARHQFDPAVVETFLRVVTRK